MVRHDIVIVGGSGFLGSMLAKHLSVNFRVKVLDVKPVDYDLEAVVDFQRVDIRKYKEVEKALVDSELVIHTAIVSIPLINKERQLGYEVNVLGIENVCKAVETSEMTRGLILSGTWHVFGDVDLKGVINEETSLRPDKVEERAKYYALAKIVQENVVRLYDEMSAKIFGIIRCGTILGQAMPGKTAARIFVSNAVKGEAITPFKHSIHRPMLYVDGDDVCRAFESYAKKILNGEVEKNNDSLYHIVNFAYPKAITILELAKMVRNAVIEISKGTLTPKIKIVDKKLPDIYENTNEKLIKLDMQKAESFLGIKKLTSPEESIKKLVMSFLQ